MDDLPYRLRVVYNDGSAVDNTFDIAQAPWDIGEIGIGGSDVAGSGVPASYEIRRDYLMVLHLRFRESERASVMRFVRHLQRSGSATIYPDQAVGGTSHVVYGHSPKLDEEVLPARRPDDPSILELPVTVRRTTQAEFVDEYF